MMENPDWHMAAAAWLSLIGPASLGVVLYLRRNFVRNFVTQDDCQACRTVLEKKDTELAQEVLLIRNNMQQLPTADQVHQLDKALTSLQGSINTLSYRIDGSVSTLDAKISGIDHNMKAIMAVYMEINK